jgi:hypothetical protein
MVEPSPAVSTEHSARISATRRSRLFHAAMALAVVIVVFVGFAPTYYLRGAFGGSPLSPLLHVHGGVFTAWVCLFVLQTFLIAKRRISIHRTLGLVGAIVAVAVVVTGVLAALSLTRRGFAVGRPGALPFLAIPLGDLFLFATLVSAAFALRHRPEAHKRLMLLGTFSILAAAFFRWPAGLRWEGPVSGVDVLVIATLLYDLVTRRRLQPAAITGALLIAVTQRLAVLVSHTDAWLTFAEWLIS